MDSAADLQRAWFQMLHIAIRFKIWKDNVERAREARRDVQMQEDAAIKIQVNIFIVI